MTRVVPCWIATVHRLDSYSSQDILNAVNAKQKSVKSSVIKDKDYRSQTIKSLESTLTTLINSSSEVKNNYKIVYETTN